MAIYGASYGGYAALVGATFTPEVFRCAVSLVGISNLETFIASIPPYWQSFYENLVRRIGDPRTEAGRAMLEGALAADPGQTPSPGRCSSCRAPTTRA